MCESRRVVGIKPQSAEGESQTRRNSPAPRPLGGLGRGGLGRGGVRLRSEGDPSPLGEAEMWRAARGLGGETSSEAKVALRPVRPRKSRIVVSGRGPSVYLGFLHLERI